MNLKPDEIAALLPEELAPQVLTDLAAVAPNSMDRGRLNIGNYCNSFDGDIHGPMRSQQARELTRQSLAEAWSLLSTLGFIAPNTDQSSYGWFFVTRRGREAAQSREAFERGRQAAQFPETLLHESLRGAAYDALIRGNFQQAVAEAFRVLEVKVRNASGLEGVGATLMRSAFHEDTGPLRSDVPDRGERQALPHLFAGAFGWVRNPACVMARPLLWKRSRLSAAEREELLDVFLSMCKWTQIYYAWRPNLRDEADNHVIELAVSGQAKFVVTRNIRDLRHGELRFPQLRVVTPAGILKEAP